MKRSYEWVIREYGHHIAAGDGYILGADIGGTNSNFGIFDLVDHKPRLILSLHTKSQHIDDFTQVIVELLGIINESYHIKIKHSCFAAAGVPSEDRQRCKPTNLTFVVDIQDIRSKTGLDCIYLANDFEVIGYGLEVIDPSAIVSVNNGVARHSANKAIIGAGTGLGKAILRWDEHYQHYMPVVSEGGHADFPPQTTQELQFTELVKRKEGLHCNVSWEHVLSGYGIGRIYQYFLSINSGIPQAKQLAVNGPHPDEIFASRNLDDHAHNTYRWYSRFYARCAKNFALESLSLGGVYIAGGIAAKNLDLFKQEEFMQAFTDCGKQQDLLKNIPISVITDYNVSLYGAAYYLVLEGICG